MFALNTRKLSTTLFISLAILVAVATVAEASHDLPLHQRDHVNLKRIVRKRSPQTDVPPGGAIGAAPIPGTSSGSSTIPLSTNTDTTSGGVSTTTPISTPTTSGQTPGTTSGASSTTDTDSETTSGASTSTDSTTDSTTSTDSDSSTSTTTTRDSSTTTPSQPEPTQAPQNNDSNNQVTSTFTSQIKSTKTVVTSVDATDIPPPELASASAKNASNVVTILVAIAASLGGVAVLWTVFRKWKLGSSKRFEKRMQPIDWQTPDHTDGGLPAAHRRNSGSSFRSDPSSRGGSALSPVPDHDFTAGGHVSPVGGYADMSRGPSPPMRQTGGGYAFGAGSGIGSSGRY